MTELPTRDLPDERVGRQPARPAMVPFGRLGGTQLVASQIGGTQLVASQVGGRRSDSGQNGGGSSLLSSVGSSAKWPGGPGGGMVRDRGSTR